jgi:hypothetical protein
MAQVWSAHSSTLTKSSSCGDGILLDQSLQYEEEIFSDAIATELESMLISIRSEKFFGIRMRSRRISSERCHRFGKQVLRVFDASAARRTLS